MREFRQNLVIHFLIFSFAVLIIIGFILAQTVSHKVQAAAIDTAVEEAVRDSSSRLLMILDPDDLRSPMVGDRYTSLHRFITTYIVSDHVARVKLWSKDGTIIYSSDPSEVGLNFIDSEELQIALGGDIALEITPPERTENAIERSAGTLMEIYTPIIFSGTSEPAGALEIYNYYAPTEKLIASLQRWIFWSIGAGFLVLYGALMVIAWGGWRRITEQKRQIRALYDTVAQERSTLTAVQENIVEGLAVFDADRKLVFRNPAMETLMGVPNEEVLGQSAAEIADAYQHIFEQPETSSQQLRDLIYNTDGRPQSIDVVTTQPARRDVSMTAFTIPVEYGRNMLGLLARDMTEEREIGRRRDSFVSVASHELRTPTAVVLGFSELLLQEDISEADRLNWLHQIHANGQRLSTLVDDMLDISRIHSGRLTVTLEPLFLQCIVDDALSAVSATTSAHEFAVDMVPDPSNIMGDPHKLCQIMINLLSNAAKYSPQGGRISVSVTFDPALDRVLVTVADEGIGISPEDLKLVFAPFHRVSRPETEKVRGSGLGLSIIKGLVELLKGEVWAESVLNEGSTFYVSIPVQRAEHQQESTFSANGNAPAEKGR